MGEFFRVFVMRLDPLVAGYDAVFNLLTIKDTWNTMIFLVVNTYFIVYFETMFLLAPFAPLLVILGIFYNYYYEVKFKRPST